MSLIAIAGAVVFFGMTIVNLFEENIIKLGLYGMTNELQLSFVIFGMMLIGTVFIFFYNLYKRYKIKKITPSLLRITDYSKMTTN
ncbi:MAG: hypothetical protein E7310_05580 [Clostridiales bacterium]|nr:hypothetical protein [Clostridiales bacterium]